jgi:hypothetical protein
MNRLNPIAGILVLLTLSAIGCGGGGSSSNASPMTSAQAATAYGDIFNAMVDAAGALPLAHHATVSPIRKDVAAGIQEAILKGTRIPVPADSVSPELSVSPDTVTNVPTYTYTCPSGGTIVVSGSYSETSSSESANLVETINSCKDGGVTFNSDPNITFSLSGSDNGTTTSVSVSVTGGLTVGSSSCTTDLNITASANDKTGSGTESFSGSFCGQTISGSGAI